MLQLILPFLLLTGTVAEPRVAPAPELRGESLMDALRAGGYTVILRHARTDRSQPTKETPGGPIPTLRSEQRNLTDSGVRDGQLMGMAFKKYKISFSEVLASPLARTVETAEYAAGVAPTITLVLRAYPITTEQAALVNAPVKPGTNRLLVTHHWVIEQHVPGITPGAVGESEGVVVRPTSSGKVELIGRFKLSDWAALAAAPATTSGSGTSPQGNAAAGHGVTDAEIPPSQNLPLSVAEGTAVGRLALRYVKAFNTGNADQMAAFINSSLAPNPNRTIQERLATYAQLFEQYGSLSLVSVATSAPTEVSLEAKSKVGDLRIIIKVPEAQSARASSVAFATLGMMPAGRD